MTTRPLTARCATSRSEASDSGILGGGQALATRLDYTGVLGSINLPALVLIGLEDPVYAFPISQTTKAAILNWAGTR